MRVTNNIATMHSLAWWREHHGRLECISVGRNDGADYLKQAGNILDEEP